MGKHLFLLVIILIIFTECKKDNNEIIKTPIDNKPPPCDTLPQAPKNGWIYFADFPFQSASFNPENPDEICLTEYVREDGERWICIYNLNTKSKKFLYEKSLNTKVLFAVDNWLVFNDYDGKLYKLKSDGTQLTEIIFKDKPLILHMLSCDKKKIICKSYRIVEKNGEPDRQDIVVTLDLDGNVLNTFDISGFEQLFNPYNDSIYVLYQKNLYFRNINSHEKQEFLNLGSYDAGDLFRVFWIDESRFILNLIDGIYMANVNSGLTKFVKRHCETEKYSPIEYSKKVNRLLCKHHLYEPKGDTLYHIMTYRTINLDGSNEEVLNIPYQK